MHAYNYKCLALLLLKLCNKADKRAVAQRRQNKMVKETLNKILYFNEVVQNEYMLNVLCNSIKTRLMRIAL